MIARFMLCTNLLMLYAPREFATTAIRLFGFEKDRVVNINTEKRWEGFRKQKDFPVPEKKSNLGQQLGRGLHNEK